MSSSVQYYDLMNDPRELLTVKGKTVMTNVKMVLNCDHGALKLQAIATKEIHRDDEILFSYGDLFWPKGKKEGGRAEKENGKEVAEVTPATPAKRKMQPSENKAKKAKQGN